MEVLYVFKSAHIGERVALLLSGEGRVCKVAGIVVSKLLSSRTVVEKVYKQGLAGSRERIL